MCGGLPKRVIESLIVSGGMPNCTAPCTVATTDTFQKLNALINQQPIFGSYRWIDVYG